MDNGKQILSFNVNGLNGKVKRCAVFNRLKKKNSIVLLQETHSSANDEHVWKSEWGNHIVFCHGSTNSKGVAILFPEQLEYNVNNI